MRPVTLAVTISAAFCFLSLRPVAQGPESGSHRTPAFATASVQPSKSRDAEKGSIRLQPDGGFLATKMTLRKLIETAYQRHSFDRVQISGGPPWIDSDGFNVVAKAPGDHIFDPDGFPRQTWRMLRTLLAERFELRVHEETKEIPIYALVMATTDAKPGPRLRKSDIDCVASVRAEIRGEQPSHGHRCSMAFYPRRLVAGGITLPVLATILSGLVDRPVMDRTGLAGNFDLELESADVRPSPVQGPSSRPSDTTQSIFEALPEQLGLRLEPVMGSAKIIVIDSAVKPGSA
ncbi:MAG: TIGR03435 family protein [Vicinamibacteraceae bacterium]